MIRRALAIAILLGATAAHGQTGPRTGGPAPGDFSSTQAAADLSLSGNAARGLVDRDLVAARGSLTMWSGPWGAFVQPYWLYGDIGGIKTDDERYVRALVFRALTGPIFAYGAAIYDQSLRRRIDRRGLFGGGFGATFVDGPHLTVLASAGVLDEVADFAANTLMDGTTVAPETRHVARGSLRLYGRYKLFGGKLVLIHDVYLLPAVRDLHDLRTMISAVLEVPIVGGFATRVELDTSYEQVIVAGTMHDDTTLTFGVSYRGGWVM